MPKLSRAFAAPIVAAGLIVAVAGCTSATTPAATAVGTERGSAPSTATPSTISIGSAPSTSAPGSPSAVASTSKPSAPGQPSQSQSQGTSKPFPGIWDITSWAQYTAAQQSVAQGHQPWLLEPELVVSAWAHQWNPAPTPRQIATDTFQVTKPGTNTVYTIHGTVPISTGSVKIWVITSITHS